MNKSLWKLDLIEVKTLCLTRRCLYDFVKAKKMSKADVENKYNSKQAAWILKRLLKEEHIKPIDNKK